ncbi:MAG: hypothetical protein WBL65_01075 [Bryobacteraceae bacterium]
MNSASMAEWIIRSLPADPEDPARALRFFELVRVSGSNSEARDIVRSLYRLAAAGTWDLNSLADLNMLVYGLRENPALIEDVSADVECILARYGVRGEISGWDYIRRRAETARAA